MIFKTADKQRTVSLNEHVLEQITNPDLQAIHIGCDSIALGGKLIYITVVAFRYKTVAFGKGAHFVFQKQTVDVYRTSGNKPDIFLKLFKETELTIDVANHILKLPINPDLLTLEFDFNNIMETLSTKLVSSASGWAAGLGLKSMFKSDVQIACKAANHICQHTS